MALDVHVYEKKVSFAMLTHTTKIYELSSYEHQELLEHGVFDSIGILSRIKDFYKSAYISHNELQALYEAMANHLKSNPAVSDTPFNILMNLVLEARDKNCHLYFVSD